MPCSLFYLCYSYTKSGTALFKNFRKGRAAAGVTADNLRAASHFVQGAAYHLVGYGVGKQDQEVRTANLFVQAGAHLGEYLCLTFVILANLFILAYHAVMASDNDNAHENPPFVVSILVS